MDARAGSGNLPSATSTPSLTSSSVAIPNINNTNARKRRTSTCGSRGVANLTPDQLAKKRANDREAQRAIRERTKGQIESLEKKIKELTSQQPYQELQHVIRQKEIVEAENEEIKKKLASALSMLQPLLGNHGDNLGSNYRDSPNLRLDCNPRPFNGPPSNPAILNLTPQSEPPTLRSANSSSSTYTPSPQIPQHASPMASTTPFTSSQSVKPTHALDRQRSNIAHGLDLRASGEKLDLGFLLDARQENHRQQAPIPGYTQLTSNPSHISNPIHSGRGELGYESSVCAYATPVRNIGPTCPLDGMLLDFLAERQRRATEGEPSQTLVGPPYPSVSSLLNPERNNQAHPLSKVFIDMLGTFPDLATLPEQLAVLYVMFLIMRWQISPTQENYDRLPEWVTPRPSQLFMPHPAWIDHLPWPRMRDKMVYLYPNIPFDTWFISYTATLSINWPYEPTDTLISLPDSEELSINPVFERHLRDLNNWTLGPAFARSFPMLVDTTKISPDVATRHTP